MKRRKFMAITAAPLAAHVAHTPNTRAPSNPSAGRRRSSAETLHRRPRGILLRVRLADCAGWYPSHWRDVPPAPFTVCQTVDAGQSLAACRLAAKHHNQQQLRMGVCSWLIVAAADGRFAEGGAA